jgi:hypothetical protein
MGDAVVIGAHLREAREYAGLSVGQAAKLLAWPAATVRAHEDGSVAPHDLELARYGKLYDRTAASLRDGLGEVTADALGFSPEMLARFDRLSVRDHAAVLRCAAHARAVPRG